MAQGGVSRERPAGGRPTASRRRRLCRRLGSLAVFLILLGSLGAAEAAVCKPGVVRRDGRFVPVSWAPRPAAAPGGALVRLRFLGHSSFLISAPPGGRVLTDPYVQAVLSPPPDAVTVSNSHETHSQVGPYLNLTTILFGASAEGRPISVDRKFKGVRVVSFPQLEEKISPPFVVNTIFVFQAGGLCIAHFGNTRFGPSEAWFRQLGEIHVLLIPIDGAFNVPHEVAAKIVKRVEPNIVIPMHYFGPELPGQFWRALRAEGIRRMVRPPAAEVPLSLRTLPPPTTYMVMPDVDVP